MTDQYTFGAWRTPTLTVDPHGPSTQAALVIVAPDGTETPITPTTADSGETWTAAAYQLDQADEWLERWTVTGTGAGAAEVTVEVLPEGVAYGGELPPLASLFQLRKKLGYMPEGDEATRARGALSDASELIRDEASKTWMTDAGVLQPVPLRVRKICVEVAYRAFVNPDALTQRSIGDSSRAYDRARLQGGEAVYLTDSEKKAVRKSAGTSTLTSVTLVSPWSGDDDTESLLGS